MPERLPGTEASTHAIMRPPPPASLLTSGVGRDDDDDEGDEDEEGAEAEAEAEADEEESEREDRDWSRGFRPPAADDDRVPTREEAPDEGASASPFMPTVKN